MTTVSQFLTALASEIGYTENPPGSNRTKFAAEAGHANAQPWCATFLVAIAKRTGLPLPSTSAYTPTMANGFKQTGRWHTSPRAGDFVFYDWPGDGVNRIQHVGVVEKVLSNRIGTIEGNTSRDDGGSQSNGGGVWRRHRRTESVVGYGRPVYSSAPNPPVPPNPPVQEDDMLYIRLVGSVSGAVYRVGPILEHVDAAEWAALDPKPTVVEVAADSPLYLRPKLLSASFDPR